MSKRRKRQAAESPDALGFNINTPASPQPSRINRFLAVTTFVSIAIAVASCVGTFYSVHVSRQIARDSGSLDKAIPRVLLQSFPLLPNVPVSVTFGAPFGPKTAVMATLPIAIHNSGTKTAKGVGLTVRLPARISIEEGLLHQTYLELVAVNASMAHKHAVHEQFGYDIYTLPDINPGQTFAVRQPLALLETRPNRPEDQANPDVMSLFSFDALVSVTAQDLQTEDYPFALFAVKTSSKDELKRDFEATINREGRMLRKSMAMPNYAWHLLLDQGQYREFLIYPEYKLMAVPPDGKVYADQSTANVTQMLYRLLSARLLFRKLD